jgi:small subunit ribosomal protein S6
MLIITPDHEENEANALIDNVKGIIEGGGNLIHLDVWGKRRLAYPIQKRSEGYYAVYVFECDPSFVAQVNQALRVIEAILRHMIVLYEDDIEKLKAAQEEETPPEATDDDISEDIADDDTSEDIVDDDTSEEKTDSAEDSTASEEVSTPVEDNTAESE